MTPERADLNAHLARLQATAGRVLANLVELDHSPTRALLDAAALTGETARRWTDARTVLQGLFAYYAALGKVLDEAVTMRDELWPMTGQRLERYTELIKGRSVIVAAATVPIGERDLAGTSTAVERRTPDELIAEMGRQFEEPRRVIADVAAVWEGVVPRLGTARDRSAALDPDLARRLSGMGATALDDPLRLDVAAVEEAVACVDALAAATSDFAAHLASARVLLDEVGARVAATHAVREHVVERVVVQDLPEHVALPPDLRQRLESIGAALSGVPQLEAWRRDAQSVVARCDALERVCNELLGERRRLRGMLDAYQAKADHLGLLEDGRVCALYDSARSALYAAPCDLGTATAALQRYQQALSTPQGTVRA